MSANESKKILKYGNKIKAKIKAKNAINTI